MMSHTRRERWLSILSTAFLVALFIALVYKAASVSFSTDEGYSYELYVGSDEFSLVRNYDANLHVIHTFLTWLSVRLFGLSEINMRLPSLLGCVIYFAAVFQLGRHFFPRSLWRMVATCILTLNPLVLDHMVVSRGYGLALAFCAWGFYVAIRAVEQRTSGEWASPFPVAVWLALSIATNLVFLFPSVGLLAALSLAELRAPTPAATTAKLSRLLHELWGPWFVFTFLLLVVPLSGMEGDEFYFGAASLSEMLRSIADFSMRIDLVSNNVLWTAAWLLFGTATVITVWMFRKTPQEQDALPLISSATFTITVLGLLLAHQMFGILYPYARTGIYLLFLIPVYLLGIASIAQRSAPHRGRWLPLAWAVVVIGMATPLAVSIRFDRFAEWPFDTNAKRLLREIDADRRANGLAKVDIIATHPMKSTLEIYKEKDHLDWIGRIEDASSPVDYRPGYDYYVIYGEREISPGLELTDILTGLPSETRLAVPRRPKNGP